MTDQYAVFGNPIAHSKSPAIHALFAEQLKQDMHYDKQLIALDGFAQAAQAFFAQGGKGLNITVPFKEQAFALADSRTLRCEKAGAANTLKILPTGEILADNTDGAGMIQDIRINHGWRITGKRVLILGAGGAVRGVLAPLLAENPAEVIIANRTLEKAEALAALFQLDGNIRACRFAEVPHTIDMIINGTSASLSGEIPSLDKRLITKNTYCYDMMYSQNLTPFLQWAKDNGSENLADGLGMLVEQAAEAFQLWRGVRPETRSLIRQLL